MNATEDDFLLDSKKNDDEEGLLDDSEIVRSTTVDETRPSATFLFFRLHNLIGVLSLGLMAIAQALPSPHEKLPIIAFLQQFYILFACAIGIVTELELSQWLVDNIAPVLKDWFARGAFYLFFAVIATEESSIDTDDSKISDGKGLTAERVTALLLNIAAGGLLCSGLLYIIMALFCLKGLKEKSEREDDERLARMVEAQGEPEMIQN